MRYIVKLDGHCWAIIDTTTMECISYHTTQFIADTDAAKFNRLGDHKSRFEPVEE